MRSRLRRTPGRRRAGVRGVLRSLVVLGFGVAAALTLAAPGEARERHDPAATRTVQALPSGDLSAVPRDFARVMGYQPVTARLSDGELRVINPRGSCSVPGEGRPFDFAVPCMAHDFGYDLLRYARRQGAPLSPDARARIDLLLDHDLRVQCATDSTPTSCAATVDLFAAGVGFNSWRQLSGPPVDTSGLTRTAGLVLLAAVGGGGGLRLWRRPRRRPGPSAR
ncbi:phospholipase A2 [Catellatospora sp. KI3]|uniref:phospholipase A2 n=1 Tax=Catellatospora sp. KI3 TaxID=3041620 RepID=UPI00248265D2|nr:phospholipase A2 [Catellatospora sp. KI3]MDI1466271.1 phospholipase A2 [Catellatospora sp. KI3]